MSRQILLNVVKVDDCEFYGDTDGSGTNYPVFAKLFHSMWPESRFSEDSPGAGVFPSLIGEAVLGPGGGLNRENDYYNYIPWRDQGGIPVLAKGTISKLHIYYNFDMGTGSGFVFTIYKNGVATSVTATITSPGISAQDITNSVSVDVGDVLSMHMNPFGNPFQPECFETEAVAGMTWNVEFNSFTPNESTHCYGAFNGTGNSTTLELAYDFFMGDRETSSTTSPYTIWPTAGTLKNFYIKFRQRNEIGPQAPVYRLFKNDNKNPEITHIVDNLNSDGYSVKTANKNFDDDDMAYIETINVGNCASEDVSHSFLCEKRTESTFFFTTENTQVITATFTRTMTAGVTYLFTLGQTTLSSGSGSPGSSGAPILVPTWGSILNMRVRLNEAPGSGESCTVSLRKNGIVQSTAVTISGSDTLGDSGTSKTFFQYNVPTENTMNIGITPTYSETNLRITISYEFQPVDNGATSIFGVRATVPTPGHTGGVVYLIPVGGRASNYTDYITSSEVVAPMDGEIRGMNVWATKPEEVEALTLMKNGVETSLQVTSSGFFANRAADITSVIPISAGDRICFKNNPQDTQPGTQALEITYSYITSGSPKEFPIMAHTVGFYAGNRWTYRYEPLNDGGNVSYAGDYRPITEHRAATTRFSSIVSALKVKKWYVLPYVDSSIGEGADGRHLLGNQLKLTFKLYRNGSDTGIELSSTDGQDFTLNTTDTLAVAAGQKLTWVLDPIAGDMDNRGTIIEAIGCSFVANEAGHFPVFSDNKLADAADGDQARFSGVPGNPFTHPSTSPRKQLAPDFWIHKMYSAVVIGGMGAGDTLVTNVELNDVATALGTSLSQFGSTDNSTVDVHVLEGDFIDVAGSTSGSYDTVAHAYDCSSEASGVEGGANEHVAPEVPEPINFYTAISSAKPINFRKRT